MNTFLRHAVRSVRNRLAAPSLIDVRDVIARHSLEEHAARADAYFAGIAGNWLVRRKPWMNAVEAQDISRALAAIFANFALRPGLRVLDFGAGTCWLSIIFAYLGCEVIATDVSARALEQGARIKAEDPIARDLPITFALFDARRLPLDDGSVDRIVSLGSFHHVADQAGTLREFYRVLRPGGIAAFDEPGPNHSRSPQSQYEMATYGVIENDIVIEEIDRIAQTCGFAPLVVAYAPSKPLTTDAATFNRWIGGATKPGEARTLVRALGATIAGRTFFLTKPGTEALESTSTHGLAGSISATVAREGTTLIATCRVANTGAATWRPSGTALGCVNVGVHLLNAAGETLEHEFARGDISAATTPPGGAHVVRFELPGVSAPDAVLVFDLVAEFVTWFQAIGGVPARIEPAEIGPRA